MPLGLCRVVEQEAANQDLGLSLGEVAIPKYGDRLAHVSWEESDEHGADDNAKETFDLLVVRQARLET